MPLETPSNAIGRIDVNQLVRPAEAVVEPRAVAQLTDAFRQGVVTADDIISRIGTLGKTREKAEVMGLEEQLSPEAQALRQAQTAAGTSQAQLAQAQAEKQKILQQYPAVAYFDALAPTAGIQRPTLPDGTPDYKKMEQIGAELAVHEARKKQAAAQLENITTQESADGSVLFARTKQGEFVDPSTVKRLRADATKPFMSGTPAGTVEAAPLVEPRTAPAPATATAPTISPVGQEVSGEPPAGQPVGGGISLGPPKPTRAPVIDPVKRAADLAASQELLTSIKGARNLVTTPGVVGPGAGSLPAQAFNRLASIFGIRENEFENQRELEILINKKVLEGATAMKGNLSDKDVQFLKSSVPKLSDTPQIWSKFLDTWESLTNQNIQALGAAGAGAGVTPTPTAAPAPTQAPVRVNSPAEAPPTAQFIQAPDGRVFKNPNYRPQ